MTKKELRVAIDCDDAAVDLKNVVYQFLKDNAVDIIDLNYVGDGGAMYPEIGYSLALKVKNNEYDRGILICGTGLGMSIIANKVEGVWAGLCHDVYSAQRLRKSNDANIMTMGARVIGPELAKLIVEAFLESDFDGGRSQPKVDQMKSLEQQSFSSE
jgi:ribose 5-phosphate isomerase B